MPECQTEQAPERGDSPGWRLLLQVARYPRSRGAYQVHHSPSGVSTLRSREYGLQGSPDPYPPGFCTEFSKNRFVRSGTGCVVWEIYPRRDWRGIPLWRRNKNSVEALCVSTEFSLGAVYCAVCRWGYYSTKIRISLLISIANICYFRSRGGLDLQEETEGDHRPRKTPTKTKIGGLFRQTRRPSLCGVLTPKNRYRESLTGCCGLGECLPEIGGG